MATMGSTWTAFSSSSNLKPCPPGAVERTAAGCPGLLSCLCLTPDSLSPPCGRMLQAPGFAWSTLHHHVHFLRGAFQDSSQLLTLSRRAYSLQWLPGGRGRALGGSLPPSPRTSLELLGHGDNRKQTDVWWVLLTWARHVGGARVGPPQEGLVCRPPVCCSKCTGASREPQAIGASACPSRLFSGLSV